ncbi:KAP family NTPase [Bacillus safensis]|uniref:P-loop NTPase fold protein n=2 Tax=Bacillus safensis TaxID=561879 RepID=UPI001C245A35|nr:P-loop NTPase fold protein [Bacillus safensis]MBU8604639.1 KAP family NTPase [Bacillus safensis]MBU8615906.1 KAP family NTPase [Bacillus safensis]MBU8627034.1 KAP family NTPase [Bacillus safensis]MCY7524033.1 KAP family NTPase [Bacillus safensis]MDF1459220.1 P-loop NTPase fold protein [Bacillus safensis]
MQKDLEIKSLEDDNLGISDNVDKFIEQYINSNFTGSILLNGKWGIGKTSYLNLIKEKSDSKRTKFIDINFWTDPWIIKPFELFSKKLNPMFYWIVKTSPILLVVLLALIQFFYNIITKPTDNISGMDFFIWGTLILTISLLNLILDKFSTESIFEWLVKKKLKSKNYNKKVIFICDDFDRLESENRKQLYAYLSKLNSFEKSILIVVGDYNKIVQDEGDSLFIQKILSNLESMPLNNKASQIWIKVIEEQFNSDNIKIMDLTDSDILLIQKLRNIFVDEQRTFREAKLLLNIFYKKSPKSTKINVNISEQLALCYFYQFHYKIYEWIVENSNFLYQKKVIPHKDFVSIEKNQLILKDTIEKNIGENNSPNLYEFLYSIFINREHDKFNFPSIKNEKNFEYYQIENILSVTTLNIEAVKDVFINFNSNLSRLIEIHSKGQMEDFSDFLRKHYLNLNSNTPETKILSLLRNIIIFKMQNLEQDAAFLRLSISDSIIYDCLNVLSNKQNRKKSDIYINNILPLDELDVSEKLEILPTFVPARSDEQSKEQLKLVKIIFEKFINNDFDILTQKKPRCCFLFFKKYHSNIDQKSDYQVVFDKLLTLNDPDFFYYLKDKLSYKITYPNNSVAKALSLGEISYNQEFEINLKERIANLPPHQKNILEKMIELKF